MSFAHIDRLASKELSRVTNRSDFFLNMTNLLQTVVQANIFIQPFYFLLTIITNLLNIRVLSSRVLRSLPCTQYFLAYAIYSIIYTALLCPANFFRAFSLQWTKGRLGCKTYFYIFFVIPSQASLMLIFASFDRYCSSSQSGRFHSKSTRNSAKLTIVIGSILSGIYMLPMVTIYDWMPMTDRCQARSNILIKIYTLTQAFLYYLLAPILTFSFGLFTIKNIRRQTARAGRSKRSL